MNRKKKLAVIGTAGVPGRYGGFETLAHHLVLNLNKEFDLTVYCSSKIYSKEERVKVWEGARIKYWPMSANGMFSIPYDIISIIHALFFADVLLILGVPGCIILPFVKIFTRKKIIVNIDGLEWRREKWSKPIRVFLKISERLAVRFSDADITDNASIKRYTAIYYKTLSHMIAYGADHCEREMITPGSVKKYPFLLGKYAFKVCRIEPENNIHMILQAFEHFDDFPLVMVGNWNNSEYGRQLKARYHNSCNVYLLDPIYEPQELNTLRSNCHIYVHGHSAGGTNPSLVEAMYMELPVLAFDVSYNRATTFDKALYFKNAEELTHTLRKLGETDLEEMAHSMKKLAEANYTWKKISSAYADLIHAFDYGYRRSSVFSKYRFVDYRILQDHGIAHLSNQKYFYESN